MDKKPEKLVPEVRFKGFTDDWEQRKLGELGSVQMNKRIFKNQTSESGDVPFYKIGTFGKKADAYISNSLYQDYKEKYPYPNKGDLLISASGSIGRIVEYKGQKAYYQDSNIVWLEHNNHVLNSFLKAFYQIVKWDGTEGSTIKRLYNKNILNTKIKLPKVKEQKVLGTLISTVDLLISLQQRKLEQLKLLEKALQQKLFPNSFQEKPLLRILHGDNSWWNSYIGEVFTERVDKGSSEKLLSVSITDGVYPFDESKRKNNSSNDKHNYKKVFQNDIAYNSMRLWQGALGVSKYEGIVSPAYTVLKPLANQNSIFYEFMFKNIDMLHIFQRNSQGLTSDTWNLKFNQLQHIKIKTTNLNSQNKIAKLLIKIEELKNNESNYYHNLMILKKYLLQKLFI
ncbi:restriction endonuclease subunit S [Limosilactobacillus reuteri]|uniref:restriction endonuclease subunit S n=1 Tax=Limosilactobacillus reuteri TaxID=1598 RepID=UPI001CBAFEAF|nr:restriction endonuclease subunit S [Limosilactobacillus reuteri]UAW61209.1 restriction endonuclease subunit S [Limosilactobacillus reuteri]